ncbi:MAG TPA: amidohydrolase family protein [Acidimicrobiales bacterium]|nr:amidohydrolase family protein [Acidimicrobiales bacterium]
MHYRVISADNHINEPPGTYVDRVPAHLKDRAPRVMRGADGGDGWSFDGKPPKVTFGLGATGGVTKQNPRDYKAAGLRWEEILPGNYDGAAHIKDNELDGVDAASIYPAAVGGAYALPDRELALACVRAYNDWLIEDFCAADPRRLLSLAFMPVNDGIPTAVAEAERVIAKGAKGLFLPLPDEVGYHDAMYDPLWKLAADAQVPVTIHRSGVSRKDLGGPPPMEGADPALYVSSIAQGFFRSIPPVSNVILTGLFDRFPTLTLIVAEVNCNWVPALAQQMDQEYERQRHWSGLELESAPSTYFGRNVLITMLDDFVGARMAREDPALAASTMFSSDYPHSVTLWPHSQEVIAELTEGMSEDTRHRILAGNAIRAFSLDAS